jgi:collagenase-like PrtC family protease
MKLSIPANWQEDFFDALDFSAVSEVYGKMPGDVVGGGRASVIFNKVPESRVREHIRRIRERGLRFNYLLNATCIDNLELTKGGYRRIRSFIDRLCNYGVDTVTLGLPFLAAVVKKNYPQLRVGVTTNVMVDNLDRVRYWEEFGADQITLSYSDVNRDFPELKRIARHARCEIQLICNLFCRRHCPFQMLHSNFHSHASQLRHVNAGFPVDFYCLFCMARVFSEPLEIVRSCWIRPEDLRVYEEIGIERFKLTERGMNTADLARIVAAYTRRRYDGNLADLLPSMSKYEYITNPKLGHLARYFFQPTRIKLHRALPLIAAMYRLRGKEAYFRSLGVYVENSRLDGFLKFFLDDGCRGRVCEECGWCREWARKAVTVLGEPGEREEVLGQLHRIMDSFVTGEVF